MVAGPSADEASDDRAAVMRRCALTRAALPTVDLIRFVAGPDGVLVPDIRNRLPGRGVWVTNSRTGIREAVKRRILPRALKAEVGVPADLDAEVDRLLRRDALQMLSLANKAGAVTSGFAKIEGMRGPILTLVEAADGSEAEIGRLVGITRGRGPRQSEPRIIRVFSSGEIALSIGREHVIHAALAVHPASSAFLDRAARYMDFLSDGPAKRNDASSCGPSGVLQDPPREGSEARGATPGRSDRRSHSPRPVGTGPANPNGRAIVEENETDD
jgi:hypothetical protein